ncbi:MAG: non-heme iron oxygenase ferredoxin subunit [Spirochaetes bacterium]|nr:non-heme iron oxygenase ferredoxin subunit [Spirochaetota bacterium]
MKEWVLVARIEDVKGVLRVEYGSQEVVLFRLSDGIFALRDTCSHEYARLSEGEVWDEKVYCPKHGSCFDIRTGSVSGLPAVLPVETIPVRIEGDEVYVYIENW